MRDDTESALIGIKHALIIEGLVAILILAIGVVAWSGVFGRVM